MLDNQLSKQYVIKTLNLKQLKRRKILYQNYKLNYYKKTNNLNKYLQYDMFENIINQKIKRLKDGQFY